MMTTAGLLQHQYVFAFRQTCLRRPKHTNYYVERENPLTSDWHYPRIQAVWKVSVKGMYIHTYIHSYYYTRARLAKYVISRSGLAVSGTPRFRIKLSHFRVPALR